MVSPTPATDDAPTLRPPGSGSSGAPYGTGAIHYLRAGWPVVPVGYAGQRAAKTPVPRGLTGRAGYELDEDEAWSLVDRYGNNNLAIKAPRSVVRSDGARLSVVGIDVDAYKGGLETLAALEDTIGVKLPPTVMSTARDDGSGIRLFTVPEGTPDLPGVLGQGIEVVQWWYRYALVAPSTHPVLGTQYRFLNSDDGKPMPLPAPADLVPLPGEWVAALVGLAQEHVPAHKPGRAVKEPRLPRVGRALNFETGIGGDFLATLDHEEAPCPFMRNVAEKWLNTVLSAEPGGPRYQAMRDGIWALAHLHRDGHRGVAVALDLLRTAFAEARQGEPWERDYFHALDGAVDQVLDGASRESDCGCLDGMRLRGLRAVSPSEDEDEPPAVAEQRRQVPRLPEAFWERPAHAHIRQAAYSKLRDPDAVFLAAVAALAAQIPPGHVISSGIQREATLNLLCALIGPSGSGKGSALDAARGLVGLLYPPVLGKDSRVYLGMPGGSAEGMGKKFFKTVPKPKDQGRGTMLEKCLDGILFRIDEVSSLATDTGRQGSKTRSVLLSAYSGENVGASYVNERSAGVDLPPHSYRWVTIVGGQPKLSGWLLQGHDGWPERWLFAALDVSDMPPVEGVPDDPGPLDLSGARAQLDSAPAVGGLRHLPITGELLALVNREHREIRSRGTSPGHRGLLRLQLAVMLGLLNGSSAAGVEEWDLAGVFLAYQDEVVKYTAGESSAGDEAERNGRARAQAAAEVVTEDEKHATRLKQAEGILVNRSCKGVAKGAAGLWLGGREIKDALGARLRPFKDEVLLKSRRLEEDGTGQHRCRRC